MKQNRVSPPRAGRTDAVQRARLLAAFERSGMSVADFARQHGIHYTTLYAWRRQRDQVKASPAFVQVELASPAPPTELLIEIGAVRLRLGTEAQLALAARLLQMLQGGPRC